MPSQRLSRLSLLLLSLIGLTACGKSTSHAAPPTATPAVATVESAIAAAPASEANAAPALAPTGAEQSLENLTYEAWTGDLEGMLQRRVVRVLTVYGPGRYYLEDNGEEKGTAKELAERFGKFLNARQQTGLVKVHVVIIPVARSQLVPALLQGYGDLVIAGLTITAKRDQRLDFSIPVSKPLSEILVTGPSAPPLADIDALSGKTVYVRASSSYHESVETLNARLAARGRAPVEIATVSGYLEDDDLIEMVDRGLLPWIIVDDYKPDMWKGVFDNIRVRRDIVFREGGRIGWAFREDSPQLAAAVNDFLRQNREGTLIGNILKNRYIRDFNWAAYALQGADYQRFLELQHLFEKYGEEYRVDYLLAAAQGYQESRLDQSARSAAGAIGVMQLLPSTAADKNVGIPDISTADNNIHAGIKYVSFLRSRYFSDPGIDRLNGTLLALAAYNAGPARVTQLRSKAAKKGYDPNSWFDNVELVAAREIGRETVQYVSNIFKYYVAYRYSVEQQAKRAAARRRAGIDAAADQ